MHRSIRLTTVAAFFWSVTAALPAAAEPPNATQKSGEIRGRVTYCASAGASGAVVHLPGKSFEARVAPSGDFQLYWVPVGRHSVAIDAPGRATHVVEDVVVTDRRITELAQIAICRDADGDGTNENLDCNDNNPNIHPGAAESCEGIDNDCDGAVDEGCVICTDADHDGYFAQAGCGGPVDCNDGVAMTRPGATEVCDAVDNDCDATVDEGFLFQSDPSNCGSCGAVCPVRGAGVPAECSAGSCLPPIVPDPEPEVCDGEDNDLDGEVDEGFDVGASCSGGCRDPENPFQFIPGTRQCVGPYSTACVCP
jgi:putative metal-binding protein/carboxypeptidase family protein